MPAALVELAVARLAAHRVAPAPSEQLQEPGVLALAVRLQRDPDAWVAALATPPLVAAVLARPDPDAAAPGAQAPFRVLPPLTDARGGRDSPARAAAPPSRPARRPTRGELVTVRAGLRRLVPYLLEEVAVAVAEQDGRPTPSAAALRRAAVAVSDLGHPPVRRSSAARSGVRPARALSDDALRRAVLDALDPPGAAMNDTDRSTSRSDTADSSGARPRSRRSKVARDDTPTETTQTADTDVTATDTDTDVTATDTTGVTGTGTGTGTGTVTDDGCASWYADCPGLDSALPAPLGPPQDLDDDDVPRVLRSLAYTYRFGTLLVSASDEAATRFRDGGLLTVRLVEDAPRALFCWPRSGSRVQSEGQDLAVRLLGVGPGEGRRRWHAFQEVYLDSNADDRQLQRRALQLRSWLARAVTPADRLAVRHLACDVSRAEELLALVGEGEVWDGLAVLFGADILRYSEAYMVWEDDEDLLDSLFKTP